MGQGPTELAVGEGGGCLDVFASVYHFAFSPFLGDSLMLTEILSQGPLDLKQPTKCCLFSYSSYNTIRDAGVCKTKIA